MPLSAKAIEILTSRLPEDKIKLRPGKGGMQFSYISADYVIETLNQAFDYQWSTKIVSSNLYENIAVVGLELTVPADGEGFVSKQQFGSGEAKGMDVGDAFKSAASDALKKCATLLGLGLELYQDEAPGGPSSQAKFTPPQKKTAAVPPAPKAVPGPRAPVTPPASPAPRAAVPAAPAARPVAPPAPRAMTASVATPVAAPKANPFADSRTAQAGPTSIQINSLTNIAARKGLTPSDMIGMAEIADRYGNPVRTFEELTRDQATLVIQTVQKA